MFVLLALCIVHASRRHREGVPYIVGAFCSVFCWSTWRSLATAIVYGRFTVMVGHAPLDVPLCIGAGWGIILYTARLFSDSFSLPLLSAAALDTLLALNIDLSMDVVAYRLHMWHWFWKDTNLALTSQWFGIPYGNFNGWVTVVFCYSAFSRLFERLLLRRGSGGIGRRSAIAALALVCSLATLFGTENYLYPFLIRYLGMTSGIRLSLFVIALLALVAFGWRSRSQLAAPLPAIAIWVPCWFHLFFVFCFFALGFYRENPWMTAAAVANILIGFAVHFAPYRTQARLNAVAQEAEG